MITRVKFAQAVAIDGVGTEYSVGVEKVGIAESKSRPGIELSTRDGKQLVFVPWSNIVAVTEAREPRSAIEKPKGAREVA